MSYHRGKWKYRAGIINIVVKRSDIHQTKNRYDDDDDDNVTAASEMAYGVMGWR